MLLIYASFLNSAYSIDSTIGGAYPYCRDDCFVTLFLLSYALQVVSCYRETQLQVGGSSCEQ